MLSLLLALSTTVIRPEDRDETERYRRRVTPTVEVAREAPPAVVFIESEGTQRPGRVRG